MKEKRSVRRHKFTLLLNDEEKVRLEQLAIRKSESAANVIRRLVLIETQKEEGKR